MPPVVPAMSAAAPPIADAVTAQGAPQAARDSVPAMNARGVKSFFATLWTSIALSIAGSYYASTLLGAPPMHPREYPFIAAVYLLWVPLVPFLVALARRRTPVLIHAGVAVTLILAKLMLHRVIFCGGFGGSWSDCVLAIRFESWLVHWYLYELLVYAATVGGTWAFDAMARAEQRELSLAEKERELAASELQAAQGHIAPQELRALFAAITEKLSSEPAEAESMITRVADSLRVSVQAMRSRG
jgi:hypothetical protein